jgi:hypothetical protein
MRRDGDAERDTSGWSLRRQSGRRSSSDRYEAEKHLNGAVYGRHEGLRNVERIALHAF